MFKLFFKIAFPIMLAGLFSIVSFFALTCNNLSTGFYIIFLLLAVFVFIFSLAVAQNFTLPIKKLLKKANMQPGKGKDEMAQLNDLFGAMTAKIQHIDSEIEKNKKLIEGKAQLQNQLLKENLGALEQKVQNRTLENQKMMVELERARDGVKLKEAESTQLKNKIAQLRQEKEVESAGLKHQVALLQGKVESHESKKKPKKLKVAGKVKKIKK